MHQVIQIILKHQIIIEIIPWILLFIWAQITVQTFHRWRKEFGGLKLDQAKRLKELE